MQENTHANIIHIVCSTDANYIMPTGVMIKSVCISNRDEGISFHVIVDESVTARQWKQLEEVVENHDRHHVLFHLVDGNIFSDFPQLGITKTYITKATYYRLLFTDLFDDNIHRLIYLDGDMIITGSLRPLWETELDCYAVGAVTDMSERIHDYHRLGYPASSGYFNAGELLRPCLSSLTSQTLRDIEIILVSDCPTDDSDKVCEDFASKDNRIKILRNEHNLHIGESRNRGLEAATGEYVGFSDDDDYQEPFMYEHLYRKAKENDYDMVVSMDTHVEQGKTFTMDIPMQADVNPCDYFLRDLLSEGAARHDFPLCTNIHPHLYKRAIIEQNSLKFGDTKKITAEDRLWNIQFLLQSKNIGILREQLYYHRNNPNSEGLRKGSGYRTEEKIMAYLLGIYNLLKEEQAINNFRQDFLIGASSELMNMLGYSLTMDKSLLKFLRLRKDVRHLPFGRDAIKTWKRPDLNPSSIVRSVIKLTI